MAIEAIKKKYPILDESGQPSTYPTFASQVILADGTALERDGVLAGGGTAKDSEKLGGKDPKYYIRPRNLLGNSDFTNLVNQRGETSYTGQGYGIDRWRSGSSYLTVAVMENGLTLESTQETGSSVFTQRIGITLKDGSYTCALCVDGEIYIANTTCTDGQLAKSKNIDIGNGYFRVQYDTTVGLNCFSIFISAGETVTNIQWAALYEGEYTVDNLPPYVPKEYAVEIVACQRRFHVYETSNVRPSKPLDCCPPMVLAPGTTAITQGSLTVDGKTLYYNSTDL